MARAQTLTEQKEIFLYSSHLENPNSFDLFYDAASQIFYNLKMNGPKPDESEIIAMFQSSVIEGVNRIRTRSPEYYASVFEVLSGSDARGDARVHAWDTYRDQLVRRFEDDPLFGEDRSTGVTLGQMYQPLRAFWNEQEENANLPKATKVSVKIIRHVGMLDELISDWLIKDEVSDGIRLVSGGPGSGKSTFAKHLAASLSPNRQWRVIFVPLQRLRGSGPLEGRINEYFRLQADEPFDAETAPLLSIGRDKHRDWLIIFDGLDELAKEGAGSESAAQDFATALADLRGRTGDAAVRFLVLGRAPSMQEARRRLGLHGKGTIHVAGMAPLSKIYRENSEKISFVDPGKLKDNDQRIEFWSRWAVAKKLSISLPEAMKAESLLDLTNEPLLAYLLILSGYVSERWQEAAENRNRIYQAIFNQIWEREKTKTTRLHLNDLGQEGFESLLQALGIAAWRGGGRTGDEVTFISVRDIFMRPDLLASAKTSGAADLSNVALLFYTRKDEEGGRGYEFLHKSFGEYLTARGLFDAFRRWGGQVSDPTSDFDSKQFLVRWLRITGPAPITKEILTFLRNEVRLFSANAQSATSWKAARDLLRVAELLVDVAIKDGLPAHESATRWRSAEAEQKNGEITLLGMLDSLARAAYPSDLFGADPSKGGWDAGPIKISEFQQPHGFTDFLQRVAYPAISGWIGGANYFSRFPGEPVLSMLSRICLDDVNIFGQQLSGSDFEGASFRNAQIMGCTVAHSNFSNADFSGAKLNFSKFIQLSLTNVKFSSVDFEQTYFDESSILSLKPGSTIRRKLIKSSKSMARADLLNARISK